MMTKEEVAAIVTYCEENGVSYKDRLNELGVSPWKFYDSKRKHAKEQDKGVFLQLQPGGAFVPNPIKPGRSSRSAKKEQSSSSLLIIELKTPTGAMMRIQGEMSGKMLQELKTQPRNVQL